MNVLITGGASGLGEAITLKLAEDRASQVYFTYSKSVDNAKRLEQQHSNCKGIHCNFEDRISVEQLLAQIQQLNIDVLINNAMTGMMKKHFHKITESEFLTSFQKNIIPVIQITQASIAAFRKKKSGKIITVLSSAGLSKPPIGWSEYIANKAYLEALSKSWATENIAFGITSNSISPSFMQTQLTSDMDERMVEEMVKNHPLKKLLTKEEVAESVLFLCKATPHINGVNLILNAGEQMC